MPLGTERMHEPTECNPKWADKVSSSHGYGHHRQLGLSMGLRTPVDVFRKPYQAGNLIHSPQHIDTLILGAIVKTQQVKGAVYR